MSGSTVLAELRPMALFSDNMVLQQGVEVPVWGWADPGERVTIEFSGHRISGEADAEGAWRVMLPPLEVQEKAGEMVISGNNERIVVRNVLVGEVWLGSGQSNMEMPVGNISDAFPGVDDSERELAAADWPEIRYFKVERETSQEPLKDVRGAWRVCTPDSAVHFSAVGYFFSRAIHQNRKVPVGFIDSSRNGSGALAWIARETIEVDPRMEPVLKQWDFMVGAYPGRMEEYERALAEWEAADRNTRGAKPRPPNPVLAPDSRQRPANLFYGMLAPLIPFPVTGVLWYQGETPGLGSFPSLYPDTLRMMVRDWRARWGRERMPFIVVQLANWKEPLEEPVSEQVEPSDYYQGGWAWIREAQLRLPEEVPDTATVVAIDIGGELHPTNKQDVGARLALAARALAYGEDIVHSGPVMASYSAEGGKMRIRFQHAEGGLATRDGAPPGRFSICGPDQKFVWAEAEIDGSDVLVWCPEISDPVAVRYAWEMNPEGANLINAEGLPASPFRTDDWQNLKDREFEERHPSQESPESKKPVHNPSSNP